MDFQNYDEIEQETNLFFQEKIIQVLDRQPTISIRKISAPVESNLLFQSNQEILLNKLEFDQNQDFNDNFQNNLILTCEKKHKVNIDYNFDDVETLNFNDDDLILDVQFKRKASQDDSFSTVSQKTFSKTKLNKKFSKISRKTSFN